MIVVNYEEYIHEGHNRLWDNLKSIRQMNLLRRTYLHCWSTTLISLSSSCFTCLFGFRGIYIEDISKFNNCKILKTIDFSKLKKPIKLRDESRQDWIFLNLGPTMIVGNLTLNFMSIGPRMTGGGLSFPFSHLTTLIFH